MPKQHRNSDGATTPELDHSKRKFVKATTAVATLLALPKVAHARLLASDTDSRNSTLLFDELQKAPVENTEIRTPVGYVAKPLLRWGDVVTGSQPSTEIDFDLTSQSAKKRKQLAGFSAEFCSFHNTSSFRKNHSRGMLFVGHGNTVGTALTAEGTPLSSMTTQQLLIDMASQGASVVEIKRRDSKWQLIVGSKRNFRITPDTPMQFSGPVRGHKVLRRFQDRQGLTTIGTWGNGGGTRTPWDTVLWTEHRAHHYFDTDVALHPQSEWAQRYGYGIHEEHPWYRVDERWSIAKNPNSIYHCGWVVEVNPHEPTANPVKHTSLGRLAHKDIAVTTSADGRLVVFITDDGAGEYLYRYISNSTYDHRDSHNSSRQALEAGTLEVARFDDDGTVEWLPLEFGTGPLTQKNGFSNQADVLLHARVAADLLKATPLDSPAGISVDKKLGTVTIAMEHNPNRLHKDVDFLGPRPHDRWGQIRTLHAPRKDFGQRRFTQQLLLAGGNRLSQGGHYHYRTSENGWLARPNYLYRDHKARLWITSGGVSQDGQPDGLWACDVRGSAKALTKYFLQTPTGTVLGEMDGTGDGTALFAPIKVSDNTTDKQWHQVNSSLGVMIIERANGYPIAS